MEKKPFLNLLRNKKYYALLVGFVVASLHFVIVLIISHLSNSVSNSLSSGDFILSLFMVPSLALFLIIPLSFSNVVPNFDLSSPALVAVSSFFYGVVGSSLASNRKILRWIGIIFIGLFVLSNCLIWLMIAGSTAGEYHR